MSYCAQEASKDVSGPVRPQGRGGEPLLQMDMGLGGEQTTHLGEKWVSDLPGLPLPVPPAGRPWGPTTVYMHHAYMRSHVGCAGLCVCLCVRACGRARPHRPLEQRRSLLAGAWGWGLRGRPGPGHRALAYPGKTPTPAPEGSKSSAHLYPLGRQQELRGCRPERPAELVSAGQWG